MHLAKKRQHVVLAQREHLDVLYDYHLVVIHIEKRIAQNFRRIFAIALRQIRERLLHALRSRSNPSRVGSSSKRRIISRYMSCVEIFSRPVVMALRTIAGLAIVFLFSFPLAAQRPAKSAFTGYSKELLLVSSTRTRTSSALSKAAASSRYVSIHRFSSGRHSILKERIEVQIRMIEAFHHFFSYARIQIDQIANHARFRIAPAPPPSPQIT